MPSIRKATVDDIDFIYHTIYRYPEIRNSIRADELKREITAGNFVICGTAFMQYKVYKVKHGIADIGDIKLELIVDSKHGSGNANVLFDYINSKLPPNKKIISNIRNTNFRSIGWHKKHGFKEIVDVSWASGSIPGKTYIKGNILQDKMI